MKILCAKVPRGDGRGHDDWAADRRRRGFALGARGAVRLRGRDRRWEAETAQEALARIESGSPDVLLIADDIAAPGAAALLKMARAAGFDGPAILLAGFEAATPEGFDGSMRRPLRFAALMAMIRAKIAPTAAAAGAALGDHLFCETTQTLMGPDGVTPPFDGERDGDSRAARPRARRSRRERCIAAGNLGI